MQAKLSILAVGVLFAVLTATTQAEESLVAWQTDLHAATDQASRSQQLVLVHFWAPWCQYCLRMDKEVFSKPEVAQAIQQNYVPVKINADDYPSVAKAFGVKNLPSEFLMTSSGTVVARLDGETLAELTPVTGVRPYVERLGQVAAANLSPTGQMIAQAGQPQGPIAPQYAAPPTGDLSQYQIAAQSSPVGDRYANQNPPAAYPTQLLQAAGPAAQAPPQVVNNPYMAPAPVEVQPNTQYSNQYPSQYGGPYAANPSAGVDTRYTSQIPAQEQPAVQQYGAPAGAYGGRAATQPGATQPGPAPQMDQQRLSQQAAPQQSMTANVQQVANRYADSQPIQTMQSAQQTQIKYGLDGYCPVSLRTSQLKDWTPGNPAYGIWHRDRLYLFAGPRELEAFKANPDYYAPVLSGNDPVLAVDNHQMVTGQRQFGFVYRDHVYLFSSQESSLRFHNNPERYAEPIRQAMQEASGQITRQ